MFSGSSKSPRQSPPQSSSNDTGLAEGGASFNSSTIMDHLPPTLFGKI